MTDDDARALREAWARFGSPDCDHASLTLQKNGRGFLTGLYVCARCGQEQLTIGQSATNALTKSRYSYRP